MGCYDGDNTAGAENKPATAGLGDCILCFFLDSGLVSENDGLLVYSTADHAQVVFQSFNQRWSGFAVVPVDNLKKVIRE